MFPQKPSFGPTSPMVGGPFVSSQMQSGAPGLGQQGPSNPAFTPNTQQNPLPGTLPQGSPMSILPPQGQQNMAPQPPSAPQAPQIPKTEAHLIIEALANRLKHLADIEKRIVPDQQAQGGINA